MAEPSQHIDYLDQLEWKRKKAIDFTGFTDVKVFESPQYHYRNRMDFFFSENIGLRKKDNPGSILDIEFCPISEMKINQLLSEIRQDFKDAGKAFKSVVIRKNGIVFLLDENSTKLGQAIEKIKNFKTSAENVVVSHGNESFPVKGDEILSQELLGKTYFFPATGFFQNNTFIAKKMHEYCALLLEKYSTRNATLLDLYGGVGCFGINNAGKFKDVWIIEEFSKSIECANKNILENGIKNAKAQTLDSNKISRLNFGSLLFVIADPPRSGMDQKTIETLKNLSPEVLIYISCNILQLRKDILKFKKYKIESVAVFDMFPNTPHIETVVELKRLHH